jgi:hypothetical protein
LKYVTLNTKKEIMNPIIIPGIPKKLYNIIDKTSCDALAPIMLIAYFE